MILPIHIAAGMIAIVLGFLALAVKKGGTVHRRSGLVFVGAMMVLGITAAILGNVFGGLMAIYFVATSWLTVRPESSWTRRSIVVALIGAMVMAMLDIIGGIQALKSPHRTLNGVPFGMLFFLATIMILAAVGDLRVLRSGQPKGRQRLARHLWRMCFALFIAAGSFFSIRARVAKVLPEPFTTAPMRMLPILLVFGAMFYWMWKVRRRGMQLQR